MSIVPKETIEVIAQSIGINNLSSDAALTFASDVEYRMREIMQESIKCMRHSRRTVLTTDDVDSALGIRNVEKLGAISIIGYLEIATLCYNIKGRMCVDYPLLCHRQKPLGHMSDTVVALLSGRSNLLDSSRPVYGFASGDPLRFKRAVGHMDLFYIEDKDVDLKDVIEAPLPKAPLDTSIMCHWLAIEGVQPAIPENAPVEVISIPNGTRPENKDNGLPIDIKLPVQHVLSRELQLYFDKITELTMRGSESVLFKEALVSLATDAGLHPLVPYFTCFVADEVSRGLGDFSLLFALMRLVRSLLRNPHIQIEPYLHQLMPSVVTCLVARRLGNRMADSHWELRDFTAKLVASICKRFGHAYNNLQPRLTKTLVNAFLDPKRAITQHYGAIQGLAALGSNVVRHLILPNLEPYLRLLEPEMLLESQKNEMKRHEAWRVYGALLHAAGQCIYDRLKMFPTLPSQPYHEIWRVNQRVNIVSGKRKVEKENIEEQPPLKKVATDKPLSENNYSPNINKTDVEMDPTAVDASEMPSTSKQMITPQKPSNGVDLEKSDKRVLKLPAILKQVWKDDLKSGQVLVSMHELFGESILPFIPTAEMLVFL